MPAVKKPMPTIATLNSEIVFLFKGNKSWIQIYF